MVNEFVLLTQKILAGSELKWGKLRWRVYMNLNRVKSGRDVGSYVETR